MFREKLQNHTFQKAHRSLSKHANIHINRATHYEIKALKKCEQSVFFWQLFFQEKIAGIWNFNESNIWANFYHIWKNWGIGVNCCWNYRPSKLLLHFIEYLQDQLNNKHTKIAVNSPIQYFEGCSQKKCLLKVWSFLVHPPQNGGLVKLLRNWMETIF